MDKDDRLLNMRFKLKHHGWTSTAIFLFFSAALMGWEPLKPNDSQFRSTVGFIRALEERHYLKPDLSKVDAKKFFETYIGSFDGWRALFTQQEVDAYVQRFGPSLFESLKRGDAQAAYIIYNDLYKRLKERVENIESRLDKRDYKLNKTDTFLLDRRDGPWPSSELELSAIWNRTVRNQLIDQIIVHLLTQEDGKAKFTREEAIDKASQDLKKTYKNLLGRRFGNYDADMIQEVYLSALSKLYDPHSSFLSKSSMEDFKIQMNSQLVGIGVTIREEDDGCRIISVIPGGPAHKSGKISAGDLIVGVGQGKEGPIKNMRGVSLKGLVQQVRGKRDTIVRIQIIRKKDKQMVTVPIKRDLVEIYSRLAKAAIYGAPLDKQTISVGVLSFNSFYNNVSGDIRELLERLRKDEVKSLVVDLRDNGGGALAEAIRVIGLFIPKGMAAIVRGQDGNYRIYSDEDPSIAWRGPIVVLVSKRSASASEIVSGSLQAYRRAILVGDPQTHGKGSVQAISPIRRGIEVYGGIRMTIRKFYLPNGESTQVEGVKSDIILPSPTPWLHKGETTKNNPLKHDKISSPWVDPKDRGNYAFVTDGLIQKLADFSNAHIESLPEWKVYRQNIEEIKEKKSHKTVSLNLETRIQEAKKAQSMAESLEKKMKAFDPLRFQSTEILLESARKRKEEAEEAFGKTENKDAKVTVDIVLRESIRIAAKWMLLAKGEQ